MALACKVHFVAADRCKDRATRRRPRRAQNRHPPSGIDPPFSSAARPVAPSARTQHRVKPPAELARYIHTTSRGNGNAAHHARSPTRQSENVRKLRLRRLEQGVK